MRICDVEGCGKAHNAKGLCLTHYFRVKRNGTLERHRPPRKGELGSNWKGDNAAYMTVHSRLKTARGSASQFACVDCGKQARDWAYTLDCPNEKPSRFGAYSTDLTRYEPKCHKCHLKFDFSAGRVLA